MSMIEEYPDCGDNSCMFGALEKRGGMRTNGGCRCFEHPRTRREMMHLRMSVTRLLSQLAAVAKERDDAVRDARRMHYLGNLVRQRYIHEQQELNALMAKYPPLGAAL